MNSLVYKGLVEIIPEKTKKFIPSNPDSLLKFIKDKEEVLERAKGKIKEMKQFYDVKEKNPVIMGQGREAFYKIIKEMKKPEKYTYNIKWTSEFKPDWRETLKDNLKRKVDVRVLTRYDDETRKNVKEWLKFNKNIKELDNEGVAISVQDDEEVMISLIKNNLTLFIKDKPFAKIMKKIFLNTYKNSGVIK